MAEDELAVAVTRTEVPTVELLAGLEEHPDAYEFLRAQYHEQLKKSPYRAALQSLV